MLSIHRFRLMLIMLVVAHLPRAQAQPEFTPQNGFGGRSEGTGSMRLLVGRPRPFHVESHGFDRPDGRFQLDQVINIQGRSPQTRSWVMTPIAPNNYRATLTDAVGIVSARTEGNRLELRYRYRGPFFVRQTLQLRPDGRTIDNVGRLTLLGIPVGFLRETITRKSS